MGASPWCTPPLLTEAATYCTRLCYSSGHVSKSIFNSDYKFGQWQSIKYNLDLYITHVISQNDASEIAFSLLMISK